ncbi:MAG: PDZ domain-containing protein [Alphaproteobacteria bacterium]
MAGKWLKSAAAAALLVALPGAGALADDHETLLLRSPTLSDTQLAFVYAGDIWIANRDGTAPRRLTTGAASEREPYFSPDGSMIAFTADYGDNADVYVISAEGGQPTRLTFHPGTDTATGWTHDGKKVAFTSARERRFGRSGQLYHAALDGGLPEKVMEADVFRGTWSEDGSQLAYMAFGPAYTGLYGGSAGWRGYRGGRTPSIAIYTPAKKTVTGIPGKRVNDIEPIWAGGAVYFLSDREDKVLNVFRYDPKTKAVSKVTNETEWDIRSADAKGGTMVYEAGGRLKTLDLATGTVTPLSISIKPDLPQLRPAWKDVSETIEYVALSPTGKRAIITARGDVFTVPVEDGSTRNLTRTDGVREFSGLWSPKGETVAYLSDESGKHRLAIAEQTGKGNPKMFDLGPDYYTLLQWGGQGEYIVYEDNHLALFMIDVTTGKKTRIAIQDRRGSFSPDVSPDGRWIAYVASQANFYSDLMLYNVEDGTSTRVSDGMGDIGSPAFSKDGKYLYFTASTNSGPRNVGLDMSSQERPLRAGIYVAVLAADGTSPLLPKPGDEAVESDEDGEPEEENAALGMEEDYGDNDHGNEDDAEGSDAEEEAGADDDGQDKDKEPVVTTVDLEGLSERVVALPLSERNYGGLAVAKDGGLLFIQRTQPGVARYRRGETPFASNRLMRFDMEEQEARTIARGVFGYAMSHDGSHVLVRQVGDRLTVGKTGARIDLKDLSTRDMKSYIDPRQEWAQIFDDAWRMEKQFFYDPNMHGLDWQAVYDRYKPLLAHVGRREDLNHLMIQMIAEMQVGHNRLGGGDLHEEDSVAGGLLGANLRIENGKYRIKTIFTGENWNPFLEAPLAAPGIGVEEGHYILAVNGRPLTAADNIYQMLEGTVGEQVTLTVSASPNGEDAEDRIVTPTRNEGALRLWAWIEANRRYVDRKTGGKVGYVYLPNTGGAGYRFFNRYFFAQTDREAMILDERSNGGGQAANYITDVLSRTYLSGWKDRDGLIFNTPGGAMYGPKVMMIDQDAGSGGDFLPYAFRAMEAGTLIGTRTWGGLIGISINPPFIDGGRLVVPYFRFYNPDGKWRIENEGVVPDIEVALDPVGVNAGRDSQLDAAIAEVMKQLQTYEPVDLKKAPAYPTKLGQ